LLPEGGPLAAKRPLSEVQLCLNLTGTLPISIRAHLHFERKFATSDAYLENTDLEKAQTEGGDIAKIIDCKIRAFCPDPGAWTIQNKKRVKLLDSEIRDGKLKLKVIQVEGKKPTVI